MNQEATSATVTPMMATQWAPARPIHLPNRPAMTAPARGASGTSRYSDFMSIVCALSLQAVEVFDMNRTQIAEQHDQDGQADGSLRRGDRQDEKDEDLPRRIVQVAGEGDKIDVDGEQHQLDRHQQDDEILPVEKY